MTRSTSRAKENSHPVLVEIFLWPLLVIATDRHHPLGAAGCLAF